MAVGTSQLYSLDDPEVLRDTREVSDELWELTQALALDGWEEGFAIVEAQADDDVDDLT